MIDQIEKLRVGDKIGMIFDYENLDGGFCKREIAEVTEILDDEIVIDGWYHLPKTGKSKVCDTRFVCKTETKKAQTDFLRDEQNPTMTRRIT